MILTDEQNSSGLQGGKYQKSSQKSRDEQPKNLYDRIIPIQLVFELLTPPLFEGHCPYYSKLGNIQLVQEFGEILLPYQ